MATFRILQILTMTSCLCLKSTLFRKGLNEIHSQFLAIFAGKVFVEIKHLAILAIHAADASFRTHERDGSLFRLALDFFHRVVVKKARQKHHTAGILGYGLAIYAVFIACVPMLHLFRPQIIKHSLYRRNLISTYN